jgi:hypothetical protein
MNSYYDIDFWWDAYISAYDGVCKSVEKRFLPPTPLQMKVIFGLSNIVDLIEYGYDEGGYTRLFEDDDIKLPTKIEWQRTVKP